MAIDISMQPRTAVEKLADDLLFRRCRIGRDAAREVAQRVQDGHGFWDFKARKSACAIPDSTEAAVLAGTEEPGEGTPILAA
jgi:hypothetical protein